MKKTLILLTIIFSVYACKKETIESKGIPVNLITVDNPVVFRKTVILYDEVNYMIKTPFDTFLSGYPFNSPTGYYDDMRPKLINDGAIKDILFINDYMKYKADSIFTLAYYLETGNCYIYDKLAKESINSIQVEHFAEGKPMESYGGRRFYIKNQLFLETVDMISK